MINDTQITKTDALPDQATHPKDDRVQSAGFSAGTAHEAPRIYLPAMMPFPGISSYTYSSLSKKHPVTGCFFIVKRQGG